MIERVTVSFDLIEEPWLPVLRIDGCYEEVGMSTLLHQAHKIRRILGQTPPMTAALYRLVLALAHRVYGPPSMERWEELWRQEELAADALSEYLAQHPQRFCLFDRDRPFFQCPGVASVSPSSAAKLAPYRAVGNNTTLFDHTTSRDQVALKPAEAARWLVTLQAYDPGGLKTPYKKVKSSQAAPANWFGLALVEGGDLKETLLLNMMPYQPGEQPPNTTLVDRPVWEEDPPSPEPDERRPKGWTDLLTWPSRRVWLGHVENGDETVVDRVVITPGTRLKAELEEYEWMAVYRRSKASKRPRTKGARGTPAYGPWYPVRLQQHRGVWLHGDELLLAPSGPEERYHQRPATLDHVSDMVARETIPDDAVYTLRVFGQQLDSKSSIVHQVLEEALATPVALLKAEHIEAGPIIGHSIELARNVGDALNYMEREFRKEIHGKPSASLELTYWPRLTEPFDSFLLELASALDQGHSPAPAAKVWADAVRDTADQTAKRWAEGSPREGRNLELLGAHYGRFIGSLTTHVRTYHGHLAGYIE